MAKMLPACLEMDNKDSKSWPTLWLGSNLGLAQRQERLFTLATGGTTTTAGRVWWRNSSGWMADGGPDENGRENVGCTGSAFRNRIFL